MFKKATKTQIKLRLALTGPSGSGKTFSSLAIASQLGKRIAVIDTEHGSASRYADLFEFDVVELESFHPNRYVKAILAAQQAGYDVVVIDSLSHAWIGKDGELELVDRAKNSFTAWKDVRPLERALIDTMLSCKCHLIATMRSRTEWVVETNDKGKAEPRKVGTAPIQTQGIEFEFDVAGELNWQNTLTITKSRCPALSGKAFIEPGQQVADILKQWLDNGVVAPVVNEIEHHYPPLPAKTEVTTNINQPGIALTDNPNREILKRVGQTTGHTSKQIAAIMEANFPGLKSNQLTQLEVKTIVDAMCVDAAVTNGGMEQALAQTTFSEWITLQPQELGNEELAAQWMSKQVKF
ncbi:MAG: ATP-binding protein [Gloeocapsa sp. UFS-A4-WI-NPMV-4B04]|jgi:hypothetical protein|nr:ATP-binding protein [Gloeocapsa sp. UFS-A4-WI-NPMV-4B04]